MIKKTCLNEFLNYEGWNDIKNFFMRFYVNEWKINKPQNNDDVCALHEVENVIVVLGG